MNGSFDVRLMFSDELALFLRGSLTRTKRLREKTSVKDVIESCGVPHPEVDLILVGGTPVDLAYQLTVECALSVFAPTADAAGFTGHRLQVPHHTRFVADGHLGKLARDLRLLGIDVAYDRDADDQQLLTVMQEEDRALLTRDRRLLMHAIVRHGYYPRSQNPAEQTREVIRRFRLLPDLAPFTRCLRCNAALRRGSKIEVDQQLEPLTRLYYEDFRRCSECTQVYWAGSHVAKLQERVRQLITPNAA